MPNSHLQNGESAVVHEINRDLKDSSLKSEMRVQETQIENSQVPGLDPNAIVTDAPSGQSESSVIPLEFEQENPGEQVLKDTDTAQRRQLRRPLTPEQRISAKLARDAWMREQQKREQDAVVKQFLDNARAGGVDVRLNQNLDVTGVAPVDLQKPIQVPQSLPGGAK